MDFDLSTIVIERAILHQVPKQPLKQKKLTPIYSAAESNLDNEIKGFLKGRVINALMSDRSHEIIFIDRGTSIVLRMLNSVNADQNMFVQVSREIADHLNRVQTGNSPGGLVAVLLGNLNRKMFMSILKLEREEGAKLHRIDSVGRIIFDIQHIRDLILTEKTRLFKIALFPIDGFKDYGFDGKVCDNQLIGSLNRDVALFFIKTLLECKTVGDPKSDTRDFFFAAQDFINREVDDPIIQARYNLHLLSYMSQDRSQINPRLFAADFLEEGHRQMFVAHLVSKGIGRAIQRDISIISSKLINMIIEFENKVKIVAEKEGFEEKVSLTRMSNGITKAEIISRIKNVQS